MSRPVALTVPQVADRLQLSRGAVYAAIGRGELPCIRIGRAVRIPLVAFEQMVSAWPASSSIVESGTPPRKRRTEYDEFPFEPVIGPLPSES